MKVFNSKLAAIGLAAFVFASCSDSNSDGPSTNPDILDATTIGLTQSDAASLAASVTNYKTSATAGARHFSRAIDENLFNGLLTMETIPTRPNTGVGEVGNESTKLQNGKFYVKGGEGTTYDFSNQTISNAEIWIDGGVTFKYSSTGGNNKFYVQAGSHLEYTGTGTAIANTDKVIVEKAGDFTSVNDIVIDGTLFSTTSIGRVNKDESKNITGPAQNVTINGNVFLYGYESPKQVDKDGNPIWSFASIRAKKLTIGQNAHVNVQDKISFTNQAEVNGTVHVGKTMEVNDLTIQNNGNVSSDISIKVKNNLTMKDNAKLTVDYLNVTDNEYSSDGTEKKKTKTGNAVASLIGNSTITVNKQGVLTFNTLKTDNAWNQIVLNSNDAKSYAVIKADKFEYTGDEVHFLSTPSNNSAAFLLQFKKNYANGTAVDFKDIAFSASYMDYDVATDGAALEEVTEPGKYHTWKLKDDVVSTIENKAKLDLVSSLKSTDDKQSATSILPYGGNLYLSYHTNGSDFGGNIEVAKMTGNQLNLVQDVYQNDNKSDFNHLNIIDGKLYLAGSNNAGAIMAYTTLNNGTIEANQGLTTRPIWRIAKNDKDNADFGDANCVVKWGNNIYVATTRGYEIYDPNNGYLHTNRTAPGKAKFLATTNDGLLGLNFGSNGTSSEEGQIVKFSSADLQNVSQNINVGAIAPTNGKNMIATDSQGRIYVCQGAKGLSCWNANGTKAWENNYVTPISTSDKNNQVDKRQGYINGVAVDNNYVYVAAGSYGLVVLDKNGKEVAHRSIGTFSANYVAVDNNYIYVAYGQNRVQVFKLTNTVK